MAIDAGRERAPYASLPSASRGRQYPEAESPGRNVFRRDCDRVIHSAAFRRLKHKTQVFVAHEGDHFRTRLTHTLEVTQIARSLARALGLDEDLAEALALAHDLGHPPFGHAGEGALDECLAACGGFDHNVQTLRVVTRLEHRYAAFDGLNLTWETLEGLIKHNGPLASRDGKPARRYAEHGIPAALNAYVAALGIPPWTQGSAEAQVAALADDIAYDAHDIDDGLRAGLFDIGELGDIALVGEILAEVRSAYPDLAPPRLAHELIRRLITRMIHDVVTSSDRRLADLQACSADDVRAASDPVVAFSATMAAADKGIKGFLYPRMYRHPRVARITAQAKTVVRDLFGHFTVHPETMPADWQAGLSQAEQAVTARRAGDFIAGMTDNFALAEHARYFDSTPDLL